MLANGGWDLTLILLTWTIWRAPTNASKWRMGFDSAFKGLTLFTQTTGEYNAGQAASSLERNNFALSIARVSVTSIQLLY